MQSKVQKWGNSLALRIPKSIAKKSKIGQGSPIELKIVGDKILIEPIRKKELTLDEILSQITEKNLHKEINSGEPLGGEIW